jgi:hypothetical protein
MEEEQDRGEERKIEQGTDSAQERGEMEGLREGRGELECWGVSDIERRDCERVLHKRDECSNQRCRQEPTAAGGLCG